MAGMSFNKTTSKLENGTGGGFNVADITILAWLYALSRGELNLGHVLAADHIGGGTGNGFRLIHGPANAMSFRYAFTTTDGEWEFPATDNQENAVAVSYNRAAVGNDPVARVNFASAAITETATPVGGFVTPNTGYCIGNLTTQNRTWDGAIRHLQFHPTILSDADKDKALRYPGSVRTAGAFWWPMLHATYTEVWTVSGGVWVRGTDPTATAISLFTTSSPKCLVLPKIRGIKHGWLKRGRLVA